MDHLTSRFRRTKRDSPTTPTSQDPSPTSPATANPKPSLPSLSITTTTSANTTTTSPLTTTPPASSNGSHSLLPKSPLRTFNHFRSARKRARSPAPPVPPQNNGNHSSSNNNNNTNTNNSSSNDGIMSTLSPVDAPVSEPVTPTERGQKPQIPPFLDTSETTIECRFQELIWRERLRSQQGFQNPSPDFQFARLLSPETKILDRYKDIWPWANNRVRLPVPEGKLDYINASPIASPSPLRPDTLPCFNYIAMQGPKVNTVEHTWRMVAQLKSPAVIVMLTDTHENYMEKCYPYFPRGTHTEGIDVGQMDEFGDGFRARVECVKLEERQGGAIQMRKLNLHVDGRGDSTVWHLLYRRWPDYGVPRVEDYDSFFELMKLSRDLNSSTDNPRIIHCSAGVGRTGTFIALETLMREVNEGAMDNLDPDLIDDDDDLVFRTVNHLREQRRTMVQADSQYAFIYKVLRRQWLERHGLLDATDNERASKRLEVYDDPFVEHNG
ncbi:protein-tyrosine phosphatase-like protein [Xylaria sp. FL1042]|nr:protein-tyrosine phosphatase-like protein [Xylaria sp. FL1042]